MVSWSLFCSSLLFQACLALNGASKDNTRQRRSLSGIGCMHNGVRADTKSGSICLCPTGYTGTNCETVEVKRPSETKLDAMNVQNGSMFSCEWNKDCQLYMVVRGNLRISNDTIDLTGNFGQLQILNEPTMIQFQGFGSGDSWFRIVDSTRNISIDSVTYKYEFIVKTSPAAIDFVEDRNVPSGSRLACGDLCRLLMVTNPLANNTCSQVDGLCDSSWTFPTFYFDSNCYTEIVFKSDPCQKLCFNVRGTPSTMCYLRLPSDEPKASCGCDALCSNATLEDVCCPQVRTINVCPKPKVGGLSIAVVTGISAGISLPAVIALIAVVCFLKLRTKFQNEIDSKADTPGDDGEHTQTQKRSEKKTQIKSDVRRSSYTHRDC